MSVFWRTKPQPERRGSWMIDGYAAALGVNTGTRSYADIDPKHGETSRQSVAVSASVDLIASLVSELPVDVYTGVGDDQRKLTTPSYLLDPGGNGYGLQDWGAQVLTSWALRGNMFGNILDRGRGGYPTLVNLWHPDLVGAYPDADGIVQWSYCGQPVDNPADVLHQRVNPVTGYVFGLSPIAAHATTIGLNLTGAQFGLQWFRDGAHPSGLLTNSEADIKPEQAKEVKSRFMAGLRGDVGPAVMGRGWDYKAIQVAPEESQFLETQKYSSAECARIFGPGMAEILGYETGGSLTYVTVEGKSVHLLVYTLNKWMTRYERLLTSMLPAPQYVKLNRNALLQTTTLDRFQAHQIALRNQWVTPNEIRAIEDQKPVPWGDEPIAVGPQTSSTVKSVD